MSEMGNRVRAARNYAGLSQKALGVELDLSEGTIKSRESGERDTPWRERHAIAKICGVPDWFMEHGWNGWKKGEVSPEELRKIADELPDVPPGE